MKLLFTSTAYPPSTGGAQFYSHMLARHMLPKHSVDIVSFWDKNRTDWLLGTTILAPNQPKDYMLEQIPVHILGFSKKQKLQMVPYVLGYYPFMQLTAYKIAKILEKKLELYAECADVIHNIRVGRAPLTYASHLVAGKKQIPFVFTPLHHPRWEGWLYRVYKNLYTLADTVIALTNAEKNTLTHLGVPNKRIIVTGMGPILAQSAFPENFRKKYKLDGEVVLFLGQHYQYKGYRQVLGSAEKVWEKYPDVHFVFIGPDVGMSEQVFTKYTDPRIHRLGKVELQEKTDALAACDLLCVPSTQESFGGVYTEAWSFAKPVIGCAIASVADVIENGVNGYLVEQTVSETADAIIKLMGSADLRAEMGSAGKYKVETQYSWKRIASLTETAYNLAVNSRRKYKLG